MNQKVIGAKNFFQSHGIHLSEEWLQSCVEWCMEQNGSIDNKDLHIQIYEQWLILDLTEIEVPTLPPNLLNQKKLTLNSNYFLQMMYVVDISSSKYIQIQKIRNPNFVKGNDFVTNQTSNGRVLQLTLTDGVQQINAVELNPISTLNLNLTPGIKIKIIGPVICRRGTILIKNENIEVLGGEVEEMLVKNAAENIMAQALKLPLNPNPKVITDFVLDNSEDEQKNVDLMLPYINNQNKNENVPANIVPKIETENIPTDITESSTINIIPKIENETFAIENLMKKSIEKFSNSKLVQSNNSKTIPSNNISTPDRIEKTNYFESDSDDIFENMDIDDHLDNLEINYVPHKTISLTEAKNYNKLKSIFKVNAKIKHVVEKLTIKDGNWYLKILITDGTKDLLVEVHPDIVSKYTEMTGLEMLKLKCDLQDEATKTKIKKGIIDLKQKIASLDGELEMEYLQHDSIPVVIGID